MIFGAFDWMLLVLFVFFLIILYAWRINLFYEKRGINYLKPKLFVGNFWDVILKKEHALETIKKSYDTFPNDKYTGAFNFMRPMLIIKDKEILKQIFVKNFENFTDHIKFTDETADPFLGANLFSLTGDKWREMRATLSPAFTSSKIRGMLPFMKECIENVIEYIEQELDAPPAKDIGYVEVEMKDLTSRLGNDVIASCAFGIKVNSLKEKSNVFYTLAKESTQFSAMAMIKLFIFFLCPIFTKIFKPQVSNKSTTTFFQNLVMNNMKTRERNGVVRQDMIHLLMLARKGALKSESTPQIADAGFATVKEQVHEETLKKINWTDEQVTAQALIFIFAGLDTVSTAMSLFLHELAMHPDIQKRLIDEIDEFVKNSNREIDYTDLNKLKYLDMVISESLRLWPPILVLDRLCVKPFTFPPQNEESAKLYKLQVGDGFWISPFTIHRDPNNYKDPNKFDPERFSDENKSLIDPVTYIPFGYGPRGCIGSRFALMELKMFAVSFFKKFEVVKTPKTAPVRIKPDFFDMIPEDGYWVGIKKRVN